jgi:hypothetical protein
MPAPAGATTTAAETGLATAAWELRPSLSWWTTAGRPTPAVSASP